MTTDADPECRLRREVTIEAAAEAALNLLGSASLVAILVGCCRLREADSTAGSSTSSTSRLATTPTVTALPVDGENGTRVLALPADADLARDVLSA